jgi:hypothetical protein
MASCRSAEKELSIGVAAASERRGVDRLERHLRNDDAPVLVLRDFACGRRVIGLRRDRAHRA